MNHQPSTGTSEHTVLSDENERCALAHTTLHTPAYKRAEKTSEI